LGVSNVEFSGGDCQGVIGRFSLSFALFRTFGHRRFRVVRRRVRPAHFHPRDP